SKTDNSSDESDQIIVYELSKNRRVSVRNWQWKVVVDIREFYVKDGKEPPGKKGISLTMDQWKILRDHVDEIDQKVGEKKLEWAYVFDHLTGVVFKFPSRKMLLVERIVFCMIAIIGKVLLGLVGI
ncbi:RNA polymerase ii transcriptional coactivator kiwi, partial [Phtheirospermum japonicum]